MADTSSSCPSCGGPLQPVAASEGGVLRCERCNFAIGAPHGQRRAAGQPAPGGRVSLRATNVAGADPQHDRAGRPVAVLSARPAARGGRWRRTSLAAFAGAVAGAVLWILALSPGWWSDFVDRSGMRSLLILFPFCGTVTGFLLASGLLWRARWLLNPWSVLGALAGAVAFGFGGGVIGFLLGLMVGILLRARNLQALCSSWALTLAVVAALPPLVASALLCFGFMVASLLPIPRSGGYQPPMESILDPATGRVVAYQPHANPLVRLGWCAALCGAVTAIGALVCACLAAVKYQERSGTARFRRRRAIGLALLGLLLNGAPLPWLFKEGWPSPVIMEQQGASDRPSATPRTRPQDRALQLESLPTPPPRP